MSGIDGHRLGGGATNNNNNISDNGDNKSSKSPMDSSSHSLSAHGNSTLFPSLSMDHHHHGTNYDSHKHSNNNQRDRTHYPTLSEEVQSEFMDFDDIERLHGLFSWDQPFLDEWSKHYQSLCRQFPDVDPLTNGEQILPNRLSMRRRLADFYYHFHILPSLPHNGQISETANVVNINNNIGGSSGSGSTGGGSNDRRPSISGSINHYLWALEKFRDCLPHLVIVVHADGSSVMLEPGKMGPFAWEHPLIRLIVDSVNSKRLSSELAVLLRRFQVPLYDGGCILGILDYRHSAFPSFIGSSTGGSGFSTSTATSSNPSLSPGNIATSGGNLRRPSVHKVWLRPTYTSILATMAQEDTTVVFTDELVAFERDLLLQLNINVYVEPEPPVFFANIMGDIFYDRLRDSNNITLPTYAVEAIMHTTPSSSTNYKIISLSSNKKQGTIPANKLRRLAIIDGYRFGSSTTTTSGSRSASGGSISADVGEFIPTAEHVLNAYKTGQPLPPGPDHVPPTNCLWRSLRWEKLFPPEGFPIPPTNTNQTTFTTMSTSSPMQIFWTLNVYCQFNRRMGMLEYPIVFWKSINRADYYVANHSPYHYNHQIVHTFMEKHTFLTLPSLDRWLQQLKRLLVLEDGTRRPLGEVVNANAMRNTSTIINTNPNLTRTVGVSPPFSSSNISSPMAKGTTGGMTSKRGRKRKDLEGS